MIQNKKFYLIGLGIVLAGLVFAFSIPLASAAGCESQEAEFSFSKFFNPIASLAEKVAKDFGYQVSLAAAPDPDFCGSDSVGCSGVTPTATITWDAGLPALSGAPWGLDYFILTIASVGNYNTSPSVNSYTVSSGLANNTTYNWSVEAYYIISGSSASLGVTNQPYGSFTTLDCAPFTLDIIKSGLGLGTVTSNPIGIDCGVSCNSNFSSGTSVILTISPSSGSTFAGWVGGDCAAAGTGSCTVVMNSAKTEQAMFSLIPPPPKSHINLSPTSFSFSGVSGGATPAGQTLNISNTGNAALNWTGSTNQGWCHLSSGSGSIAVGSNSNVTVSVDAPTNVGSFPCAITISDANADNSPQITSVTYTVTPVYNCERCSTVNNYTYVNFQSNSADCSNPFNVVYTCQPSCGIVAGNQTYDSCTAALLNNASCIGITAPNSVTAGQSFSATVTMSNTGTKPWTTDASPHKLGSQNPQDNLRWGLGRVGLPSSPINSGQSATFNFTATATTTPGTYPFDWKMVEDTIEWFGATCSKTITVNAAPTCIPSCGSCSVSCGGGTQICVRVDCSTYSQACNTQACVSAPGNFRLSLGGSGAAACNSVPLSWTAASGADGYRIFRESPRVNISPYQPYTALNFIDTTVSQNTSYRYQIEAYNSGGTNRSNTISVDTPYCPPTLNLFAAPTSIYQGQSSTLSWATSYTTSCTASGGWSGSKPLNGSQLVVPLPPPSLTYNLQCSGPGGSVSGSVTINIAPLFLPDWVEIAPR